MPAASRPRFRAWSFGLACLLLPATMVRADAPAPEGRVDFERHVMGLFGRLGCNAGSCHGSFQGKGGFRLSLFGYDPEKDYYALSRDALARRLNPVDPDRSLLLLKAAGQVEHGGGKRFDRDSWQYRALRDWIAGGARWQKGSGEVAALTIAPTEVAFAGPGQAGQLRVSARFADGTEEDVTRLCDFRSNDDAVAEVSAEGHVKGLRPGDTAVVVAYRGTVQAVRVLVPYAAAPGFVYPDVPTANFLDRAVLAKLRRLNVVPSDLASDAAFLRRVTIDTTGGLPSPEDVRAFLADPDPDKRAKKIDELLTHPLHAALWATKFCDITGNNTDQLENPAQFRAKRSQMWHDWFRMRLGLNVSYDEIVRGVLCATSRDGQSPEEWLKEVKAVEAAAQKGFESPYASRMSLDLFWRRQQANVPIEQWGERTAAAFLGVRLECAQCHKHPFDRWTQADYRAYANLFGQVTVAASPEARKLIDGENQERAKKGNQNQVPRVRELFVNATRPRALPHPDTNRPLPARALGGPEIKVEGAADARAKLFEWLRSPDNPYFARAFVNRVWGHYFGVGIVEPVDNFSVGNPPSNDRLLDELARDFVEHGYDIRHVERVVLNSRTYQLSAVPNATNRLDRRNYSHAYVRPLLAEAVVDVLNDALGLKEAFGNDGPPGCRAVEIGSSRLQGNGNVAYAFRIFGRSPRTAACDCERAQDPALPQKLFLMSDPAVLNKLQAATRGDGRLAQLLKSGRGDDDILEELFLAMLTRPPTPAERRHFEQYRSSRNDRERAFADTLWALLNTREFILNH
jgi:hypothetical protein